MWPTFDEAVADVRKMQSEVVEFAATVGEPTSFSVDADELVDEWSDPDLGGQMWVINFARFADAARLAGLGQAIDLWLEEWGHIDRATGDVFI